MNAELDATIGPILSVYAHDHGVIMSASDGDEPGLQMNLVPLGAGPRPDAARDRQRQGPAGPVPQPDDAAGLRGAVGPEPGDGHVVRRRLEDQLRADDRRERDGLHGAAARHVARRSSTAARHGHRVALRRRRGSLARRRSSTTRSGPRSIKVVRARRARRPEAAALPQPLQDGRGPALSVLDPVPPAALRGARARSRASCSSATISRRRSPARRSRCARSPSATSKAGETLDDYGDVHDLRRGRRRRRDERAAATCRRASSRAACSSARSPKDSVITYDDVDLPAGPARRPAPRRAVRALPRRDLARGTTGREVAG